MKNRSILSIAKKIVKFCISTDKKFLFISGNGGSGKTELSKIIAKEMSKYGSINLLETDDFVVDTKLRNSGTVIWEDNHKKQQKGRYTTSIEASYFLQNIKAIIYNIKKWNNYYHWPKKATKPEECILLYWNAILTIVEGVGTAFLEKEQDNSVSIFLWCKKKLEIDRRMKRGRLDNEKNIKDIKKIFDERNSQFKAIIKPHISEYPIILESIEDFSLNIIRDDFNVL